MNSRPRPGTILVELTEPQVRALIEMVELDAVNVAGSKRPIVRRAAQNLRAAVDLPPLPLIPEHPGNR